MKDSIKFNLKPNGLEIEDAGEKSRYFLKSHGFSDDTIHAQIVLLKELINIGINYGKTSSTENEIIVHIHIDSKTITLEVKNPIDETCWDRLVDLDKNIQSIRGFQDPYEAYMVKRKEASQNSHHDRKNGLRLAEIAYKGKAVLDFFVNENNILNLTAVRNLDSEFIT